MLLLFFGMLGSHAYIYLFDHLRAIKTIPKCIYSAMEVDWWAQWMLAPITANTLSGLVFKPTSGLRLLCLGHVYTLRPCSLLHYFIEALHYLRDSSCLAMAWFTNNSTFLVITFAISTCSLALGSPPSMFLAQSKK